MEITVETSSYNHRRFSKPWIARVARIAEIDAIISN